ERHLVLPYGDVAGLREHPAAAAAQIVGDGAQPLVGPRRQHEPVARVSREPRGGGADPGAGAGDEHHGVVRHGAGSISRARVACATAMGELRTEARFPTVARGRGHYESFFIRTFHPSEPLGVWIRYTVLKRPGEEPRGSLWITLFDAAADGPTASKVTLGPGDVFPDAYLRVGNGGAQHAERWIWMHGIELEGANGLWLDLGFGRIKLGPLTTPWTGTGALSLDGERLTLGGPAAARRTEVHERPDGCRFTIPGPG